MVILKRFLFFILLCCFAGADVTADQPSFTRDIQPIFAEKCFGCHGPDQSEGGLQLHDSKTALGEVDSGLRALVPGKLDESTLFARIISKEDSERMPPEGDPLSDTQIKKIKAWIEAGATYDQHWAYVPVQDPALPPVKNSAWVKNEIDRFVLHDLEEKQVAPSKIAPRSILVKRLYYDLVGLPPTPKQVDQFVNSPDPDWYENLVDELLASKHFGERWGRHWLDKARYADSDGYEKDRPRLNAWRYRDWVIDAINQDLPYDQFTIEQLAGDLLPDATDLQKLATAFHRQTLTNTEGGTDKEEFRVEATFDRTETVGAIWLGLTLTCARCHTHKYDQITQDEYYRFYSFFNNANEANSNVAIGEAELIGYEKQRESYQLKLRKLKGKWESALQRIQPEVEPWLAKLRRQSGQSEPVQFHDVDVYKAETASGAKIEIKDKGVAHVSGTLQDKDKYTLFIQSPLTRVSGIRLEVLDDDQLPGKGPGRAPNGNFVLSQLRAYTSKSREFKKHESLDLVNAEADFSQKDFSPEGALSPKEKTGWAISPQMGKSHSIIFFLNQPIDLSGENYLQVVLDQQYGGRHLIGKFRIQLMTGYDSLRSLPKELTQVVKAKSTNEQQRKTVAQYLAKSHPETKEIWSELEQLKKKAPVRPVMKVRVMVPAKRTTHVLHRGDFQQPGKEVQSGALAVINRSHPLKGKSGDTDPDRMTLARWLVHPEHPLTARVTVNQVWAHLFGTGIVATLNDFGVRGELPSHPQLLDWLAWKFPRTMNWSRKKLIRKIVLSSTYRQDSRHRDDLANRDPENRWLAKQNRVRVPAETVRDLYLAASGLLSRKVGGPSVFPPMPSGVADLSYANNFKWKTSKGQDRYRRGMYTFFKRTSPHPNLISFDCPDSNTTKIKRDQSNTPLQALVTLNNEIYVESAQAMARRVLESDRSHDVDKVRYAMRLCIYRNPSQVEVDRFVRLLHRYTDYYQRHGDQAKKLVAKHNAKDVAIPVNAAWVATVRMIMNLEEFIVRD